jgi:hypothetical protein
MIQRPVDPFDWEFRKGAEVLPVKTSSRLLVSDVGAMLGACQAGAGIAQIMRLGSHHSWIAGLLRAFIVFCIAVIAMEAAEQRYSMSGAEPARGPGPGQACGEFLVHIPALILCQVGGNKCRRKLRVLMPR